MIKPASAYEARKVLGGVTLFAFTFDSFFVGVAMTSLAIGKTDIGKNLKFFTISGSGFMAFFAFYFGVLVL